MRKIIPLICLLLTACGAPQTPPPVLYKEEKAPLALSYPDPVVMDSVKWYAVNKDNIADLLQKNPGVFAISPEDFQKLVNDMGKLNAYIVQDNKIIASYKQYYESGQTSNPK